MSLAEEERNFSLWIPPSPLFRMRRQLSPLGALPVQHSPVWTFVHAHGLVPSLGGLLQAEVAHNTMLGAQLVTHWCVKTEWQLVIYSMCFVCGNRLILDGPAWPQTHSVLAL